MPTNATRTQTSPNRYPCASSILFLIAYFVPFSWLARKLLVPPADAVTPATPEKGVVPHEPPDTVARMVVAVVAVAGRRSIIKYREDWMLRKYDFG